MMVTAFRDYTRHIHNGADGFKESLVKAGKQGCRSLWTRAGICRRGALAGASQIKDLTDYWRGNPQAPAELRGNAAGKAVGQHMFNFLSGLTPRDPSRLKNSLMDELCE